MTSELPIRWFSPAMRRYFRADPPVDAIEVSAEQMAWVMAEKDMGNTPRFEAGAWKSYPPDAPPPDVLMRSLRRERDKRLRESDFSQADDVREDMTQEQRQAWRQYRRALRDLPSTYQHGEPIQWPTKPGKQ